MIYLHISSRMAQVQFFYSLTLIFIFKVKIVAFFLICEYLVNGEKDQMLQLSSDRKSSIFHPIGATANAVRHDFDQHFQGREF